MLGYFRIFYPQFVGLFPCLKSTSFRRDTSGCILNGTVWLIITDHQNGRFVIQDSDSPSFCGPFKSANFQPFLEVLRGTFSYCGFLLVEASAPKRRRPQSATARLEQKRRSAAALGMVSGNLQQINCIIVSPIATTPGLVRKGERSHQ